MNLFFKTIKNILFILPRDKIHKFYFACSILFLQSVLEVLGLGAILPVFIAILEDNFIQKYNWAKFLYSTFNLSDINDLIIILTLILLFFIIAKNILSIIISKYRINYALSIYKDIALSVHEKYYFKDYQTFKVNNTAELWRNLNQATYWFSLGQVIPSLIIFNELIIFIIIITFLFFYNTNAIIILILCVLPLIYLMTRWINKKTIILGQRKKEIDPILLKNYYESILGFTDIIVTGSQQFFRKKIEKNIKKQVSIDSKATIMNEYPIRAMETSLVLAISVVIIFGIMTNMQNSELLALLGVIGLAGYRLAPTINRISINLKTIAGTSWANDIIIENMKIKIPKNINEKLNFKKSIILKNISFSYNNHKEIIINDLSIQINKGDVIGIVGESGSGKTTLINILLGLLIPTKGEILIDGNKLKNSQIIDYRAKIGYVSQHLFMIDDSIARNVAFGQKDKLIDHQKLKYALKLANLWGYIKSTKLGINAKVGENGSKLSGGQRQRIGIARAIYFNSEILLFDEATSSLDKKTEEKVTKSITQLMSHGLTMVIISHNEASLKYCNKTVEIKNYQKINN